MLAYQDLSTRAQVARLRPVARSVARQFGWDDAELRLLNHGYNTTFELRRKGEKAALRINVNSDRTPGQLRGEVAWVHALQDSEVWVPRPYPMLDGSGFIAQHPYADLHARDATRTDMYAVLYSWLPGKTVGHQWSPEVARELGRVTTLLHEHGRSWHPPKDVDFSEPPDVLIGCKLNPRADLPDFQEVLQRGNAVIERLRRDQPMIPIHFDLHMWNLKWTRGRLSVFDFDDCRMAWPAWDVAVTLFYLRRFPDPVACEAAYWEGLGLGLKELGLSHAEMEALIAARGVFLASEMLSEWTAEVVKIGSAYLETTQKRVAHYLETGIFDTAVASVDA